MKHTKRRLGLTLLVLFLLAVAAGCSDKGVHMPKHRKRRHCDCPTFSHLTPPPTDEDSLVSII